MGDIMMNQPSYQPENTRNKRYFKLTIKTVSILILVLLFLSILSGSTYGGDDNGNSTNLGWILFYITLVVLIIIVILWIITYVIMRGVISRMQSKHDKLRRYESRKDSDLERKSHEEARERKRSARTPKGNCIVCNRKFIPGADAYMCECGKFIHVHCLSEISLCPHCGRELDKDYGIVRVETPSRRGSGGSAANESPHRIRIDRLIKARFCPVCNKIIKAGDCAMECSCNATFHEKCSYKARTCPKCGKR